MIVITKIEEECNYQSNIDRFLPIFAKKRNRLDFKMYKEMSEEDLANQR